MPPDAARELHKKLPRGDRNPEDEGGKQRGHCGWCLHPSLACLMRPNPGSACWLEQVFGGEKIGGKTTRLEGKWSDSLWNDLS